MKAVRIHAPGGPEVLKYEDAPQPSPKAGEAVVKVDAAGLNYIDEYTEQGLQDQNIHSFDVITPLLQLDGTWSGFVAAISNFFGGERQVMRTRFRRDLQSCRLRFAQQRQGVG